MREFSWNVFAATGNLESYLLYKEYERIVSQPSLEEDEMKEVQEG